MITLRPMLAADIPAGLGLCRAVGWNQRSGEWELFLQKTSDDCLVAIDMEGNVVGTVTTICYEDHFSWIGMLLVNPANRRQGVGTQLLQAALHTLEREDTVKLDATPDGREVYLKLDFLDEYRISRMLATSVLPGKSITTQARPILQRDFSQLIEFDREVFGAERKSVLEWIWREGPQFAFLTESQNQITGYCFGRRGHSYTHIGPVISQDRIHAVDLVATALQNCSGHNVILDGLLHTPAWQEWLASNGFVEQRNFIRMYRGSNAWPGIPKKQFAIMGPEFG